MRAMAFEFKQGFDELGRQAELEELRKEVDDLRKHTGIDDIQKELESDRINLEKDVSSAMAPGALPHPEPAPFGTPPAAPQDKLAESKDAPSPGTPAAGTPAPGAANGAGTPAIPAYAGLSADHPGYDTGDDFRPAGHGPEPEPAIPAGEQPQPVKQDTPA
jgi:sec-independent protein translocase protein TatB